VTRAHTDLYFDLDLTFFALLNWIICFKVENISATELGGGLMNHPLITFSSIIQFMRHYMQCDGEKIYFCSR